MNTVDKYIWAWRNAGMSDENIAAKLAIAVEDVERRYNAIKFSQEAHGKVGIDHLITTFNATCFQYQLLGEQLKVIGENLSEPASPEAIRDCIVDDKEQTLKNLISNFIILNPFKTTQEEEEEDPSKN